MLDCPINSFTISDYKDNTSSPTLLFILGFILGPSIFYWRGSIYIVMRWSIDNIKFQPVMVITQSMIESNYAFIRSKKKSIFFLVLTSFLSLLIQMLK